MPGTLRQHAQRWSRVIAFLIALTLVAAAVWALAREPGAIPRTIEQFRERPWWHFALWLVLPGLNWVFSTLQAWALLRPSAWRSSQDARNPSALVRSEMFELIGATTLANLLPFKPGLFSRVVYHKAANDIPVSRTARSIAVSIVLGLAAALLLVTVAGTAAAATAPGWLTALLLIAPWPGAMFWGYSMRVDATGPAYLAHFAKWRVLDAFAARYADVLCWMGRYMIAFSLIGYPLSLAQAAAFAAVSHFAMLVPLPGNALGLREWAIALVGPLLPSFLSVSGNPAMTRDLCLSADLVNSAGGIVMTILIGSVCSGLLAQRLRFRQHERAFLPGLPELRTPPPHIP